MTSQRVLVLETDHAHRSVNEHEGEMTAEMTKTYRRIDSSGVFFVLVLVILLTVALTLVTILAATISGTS